MDQDINFAAQCLLAMSTGTTTADTQQTANDAKSSSTGVCRIKAEPNDDAAAAAAADVNEVHETNTVRNWIKEEPSLDIPNDDVQMCEEVTVSTTTTTTTDDDDYDDDDHDEADDDDDELMDFHDEKTVATAHHRRPPMPIVISKTKQVLKINGDSVSLVSIKMSPSIDSRQTTAIRCTFNGCDKRFDKISTLKVHLSTHTGKSPPPRTHTHNVNTLVIVNFFLARTHARPPQMMIVHFYAAGQIVCKHLRWPNNCCVTSGSIVTPPKPQQQPSRRRSACSERVPCARQGLRVVNV